jgi:hypothetical protein
LSQYNQGEGHHLFSISSGFALLLYPTVYFKKG